MSVTVQNINLSILTSLDFRLQWRVGSLLGFSLVAMIVLTLVVPQTDDECKCPELINDQCGCDYFEDCLWKCRRPGSSNATCYDGLAVMQECEF
jgi:hypothetical protein